jgi:hypothetical protein
MKANVPIRTTRKLLFSSAFFFATAICLYAFVPIDKSACFTVPPGHVWRSGHCSLPPPGCRFEAAGCLQPDGNYLATNYANNYVELTYTACHFINESSFVCNPQLPSVPCMTFSAFTPNAVANCGTLQCTVERTTLTCLGSLGPPPDTPPGVPPTGGGGGPIGP